jgi:hypothetical protein
VKIPADAVIPREKLTRYLLTAKPKNDKSRFLAQTGFTAANPDALEDALRRLIATHDAVADREDAYGRFYQVAGDLRGPRGTLRVVTVWIEQHADGVYRFVTLKPAR